jgi:hypothetical protein
VSDSRGRSKFFPLTTGQIFSLRRPDLHVLAVHSGEITRLNSIIYVLSPDYFNESNYRTLKTTTILVTDASEGVYNFNSHVKVLAEGEVFWILIEDVERYFDDSDRVLE